MMKQRLSIILMATALFSLLLTGCGALETAGNARDVAVRVATALPEMIEEVVAEPQTQGVVSDEPPVEMTATVDELVDAFSQSVAEATAIQVTGEQAGDQVVEPVEVDLSSQEKQFIDLYNRVNPGVVSVFLTSGGGSGFVIDPDGFIVTNNHVIAEGGPIAIIFADGETKTAEIIGTDSQADLALLKVEAAPGELTVLPLGDSDSLEIGQFVVAIGSPFGLSNTMTTGIVSGLSRSLPADRTVLGTNYQIPSIIQTDAAINPGNSGGPLFTLAGEVVGVNTAIESPVRANSGVGFAVPSNIVKTIVAQLREGGTVKYPWLGIAGGTLSPDMAEEMGLDRSTRGVVISQVTLGGPAASAGLRGGDETTGLGGDIVISVDGRTVTQFDDLLGYIVQQTTVGQTIELTVLRNGETQLILVTLGERPVTTPQE
jgi:serine protease Do